MAAILIIGAGSDIAHETARVYAEQGYDLYLAARNLPEVERIAQDIRVRTSREVISFFLDITAFDTHADFYASLPQKPIGVISAVGYLGDQVKAQKEFMEAKKIIDTNYTGVVSLLNIIADDFEQRGEGFIVGISSVAGDRGRKSNYLYGSAKAGLTAYLSGLRNRLAASGVKVLTVKPGFVKTKMTEGLDLPEKLTASATQVAHDIYHAQQKGKDIVYTKWIWRWIMAIIRAIPEWKFKGLSL